MMKIVCVSHNAPPLNNAEALCTSRLLSCLVELGAGVHLVAAKTEASLDPSITAEIFDSRIQTTYVPIPKNRGLKIGAMASHLFHGQSVEWVPAAVAATREVLRANPGSILISRAFPMASNIAAYYCRDLAKAWVPHFSDPFPPFEWQNHWYSRFLRPVNRRWARRIVGKADLVTVTCANAGRYIEEKTGIDLKDKCSVVTHLALPKLAPGTFRFDRMNNEFVVAHIGNLMLRRRPDLLLKGLFLAMERHPEIRFLQYGHVDSEVLDLFRGSPAFGRLDIRKVDNLSPRDAADLQQQVDVNVIVDTDLGLPYSPFILSKYPHSVCAGKPLLMLSSADSEMARMTAKYGCGEFVPFSTPEAVSAAVCRLYEHRNDFSNPETRKAYEAEFSAAAIVEPFLDRMAHL